MRKTHPRPAGSSSWTSAPAARGRAVRMLSDNAVISRAFDRERKGLEDDHYNGLGGCGRRGWAASVQGNASSAAVFTRFQEPVPLPSLSEGGVRLQFRPAARGLNLSFLPAGRCYDAAAESRMPKPSWAGTVQDQHPDLLTMEYQRIVGEGARLYSKVFRGREKTNARCMRLRAVGFAGACRSRGLP